MKDSFLNFISLQLNFSENLHSLHLSCLFFKKISKKCIFTHKYEDKKCGFPTIEFHVVNQ